MNPRRRAKEHELKPGPLTFWNRDEAIQVACHMADRDRHLYDEFSMCRDGRVYWVVKLKFETFELPDYWEIMDHEPPRHPGDDVVRLDARE